MADEIDITKVDWNVLTPEQFNKIESLLQTKHQAIKKEKRKTQKRFSGFVTVKIRGNAYNIKTVDYQRLKSMKSEGSREKLITAIISTHTPIPKA